MELLPRYLKAVKGYLPKAQQSDIIAELSDAIQSQAEDKEEELGRPLTPDEESEILKAYGPPLLAASRYRKRQHLIGPALLPYYWNTLKIVLLIAYVWIAAGTVILVLAGNPFDVGAMWGIVWGTLIATVGIVTIVFACLEYFQFPLHFAERWNPKALPAVHDATRVARSASITELIFNILAAAWLLGLPSVRHVAETAMGAMANHAQIPFVVGPWWQLVAPALLISALAHAAMNCVTLVRPDWWRVRAATFVATHSFLLVVALLALRMRPFVSVAASAQHAAKYVDAAVVLNGGALMTLITFAMICVIMVGLNLYKLLRRDDSTLLNIRPSAEAR